jgi:hypothetical protein
LLLDLEINEIAIRGEFTYQRIDLPERQLRLAFQIAADEAVLVYSEFKCSGTGIIDSAHSVLLRQSQNAQHSPNAGLPLMTMDGFTEWTDMRSGPGRTRE